MYPNYPVLDMIQRIHLRCGLFESKIRFWILVRNEISVFGLRIRIWILQKKRTPN